MGRSATDPPSALICRDPLGRTGRRYVIWIGNVALRLSITNMEAVLYFAVLALLSVWALFWVIRLAVRYGVNDALQMNRGWIRAESKRDSPTP